MMVVRLGRIRRCCAEAMTLRAIAIYVHALWGKSGTVCSRSATGICDVGLAKSPSGDCPGGEPC